jgi:hypothetical protein
MKKSRKTPTSDEAADLLGKIERDYLIDDPAGQLILRQAREALGRLREAQEIIKIEGCVIRDRFRQPKQHPATLIERDSRSALLQAIASLHLDIEPLKDMAGRPPGR